MQHTRAIAVLLCSILLAGCGSLSSSDQGTLDRTPSPESQPTNPAISSLAPQRTAPIEISPNPATTVVSRSTAPAENAPATQPANDLHSQADPPGVHRLTFGPWEQVTALSWSANGKLLAAAAGESIYLYETGTLTELAVLQSGVWSNSLAFDSAGSQLTSGHNDGFLRVWSLDTFSLTMEMEAHKRGVSSVAYQPQGDLLASGGKDAVVRLWDNLNGENRAELIGGSYAVPGLAFTPDGLGLAILNGDTIRIREVSSERFLFSIFGKGTYYSIAIDPQGESLAAGKTTNTIDIWGIQHEPGTPREIYEPLLSLAGHSGRANSYQALVWTLAFSPDGKVLASGGGDHTIRLWDAQNGELLQTLEGHQNAVTSLAFHPQGTWLASGSLDSTVIMWELSP